jgi:hypothetical protein
VDLRPPLCILEAEICLFTRFQTRTRDNRPARPRSFAVVALLCLALLALLTVAQVTHIHENPSAADHCPLCIALHTAVPVTAAPVVVLLAEDPVAAPVLEVRPVTRNWHPQLFTRPPPAGC